MTTQQPSVFFDVGYYFDLGEAANGGYPFRNIQVNNCFFMKRDGTFIDTTEELKNYDNDLLIVRRDQQGNFNIPNKNNFDNYPELFDPDNPDADRGRGEGIGEDIGVNNPYKITEITQREIDYFSSKYYGYVPEISSAAVAVSNSSDSSPSPSKAVKNKTLEELNHIIHVFDMINQDTITAKEFFEYHEEYHPFIIVDKVRENPTTYSINAIDWDFGNKEFVECVDNAPSSWQGNSYARLIKPGGRRFVKVFLNGAGVMISKPDWYDYKIIPGTGYFKLIHAEPVFLYMTLDLAEQNIAPNFNSLGADHCNQTKPQQTYRLVELSLEELNDIVPLAGGYKRRKQSKRRKYTKRRKQSKRRKYINSS